jgi:protocatechuate 3,4-dioxygenase beta subunit
MTMLSIWIAVTLAAQSDATGSIAGTVRNAATGAGVKRAVVYLNSSSVRIGQTTAVTDASGSFRISGLPAGAYRISANHPDYPQPERVAGGVFADAVLDSGEQKKDIVIRLSPAAVVEGRVRDEEGDGLPNCSVAVLRYQSISNGAGAVRRLAPRNQAVTNDVGEYRIFDLPPGRYYVRAQCRASQFASAEIFQDLFHPGVPSLDGAARVKLDPGAELRGVDFRMRRVKAAVVAGRLTIPAVPNLRPDLFHIQLAPRSAVDGAWAPGASVAPNGEFRVAGVPPGEYLVTARSGIGTKQYYAEADLMIGDKPPGEVNLLAAPLPTITGTLRFEGAAPPNREHLRVWLQPSEGAGCSSSDSSRVSADGGFTLTNVHPGECVVLVSGYGGFVKAVRMGGEPAQGVRIRIRPGSAGPLEVTVSDKVGGLEASASGAGASSVMFVLAPESSAGHPRFQVSEGGRSLHMGGLAPGEYRLYALETSMMLGPEALEVLRELQSKGAAVKIEEGGRATAQVDVIAARLVDDALARIE